VPAFRAALNGVAREHLTEADCAPLLAIDAEVRLEEIDDVLLEFCERLEPFGEGNPQPVLLARAVEVVGEPALVGKEQRHLRLTLRQGNAIFRSIGFAMSRQLAQARQGVLDIVFSPQRHVWNEREERQLVLRDLMPHVG
jgi:single-stranded-DNA-specific exonuclease